MVSFWNQRKLTDQRVLTLLAYQQNQPAAR